MKSRWCGRLVRLSLILFLFLWNSFLFASYQTPSRITNSPHIDGILNEDIWKQALIVSDFIQRLPREGSIPTERTEMRILYSESSLFLGFTAYDTQPQKIVATVYKRDDFDVMQNDQLAFAIDSYNDGRNGYWFSTNPLGARVDAQFANEGDLWESNWNGIWECKTKINSDGWVAEIEIPFSTLRFRKSDINIMGINFFRRIVRTNEQIFAPLIPLQLSAGTPNVSAARKYQFEGIQEGEKLFVKPYGLGGFSDQTENTEAEKDGGLDVRYQVTNSLISNFSANMDFAEADVDDRQVNLTRFRLFFPEKREFFLESAGNFQFGISGETEIFFSRRIGLTENSLDTVPILFGAKLTGKIKNWDIGALDVQTHSNDLFPSENFSVLRLKGGISSRSYVGGIFTNRSTDGHQSSQTYGLDMNLYLWKETFLTGFATGIYASNSKQKFLDSSAFDLNLWRGGERTSFRIRYTDIAPEFDPAIGFVQRPDTRRFLANILQPFYTKSGALLSLTPGFELIREENHDGMLTYWYQQASFKTLFQSEDQFRLFVNRNEENVPEEFPVFRDLVIPVGNYVANRFGAEASTKPGRKFSSTFTISNGGFYGGSRFELSPSLFWKVNRHVTLSQTLISNFVHDAPEDFNLYITRTRISYSLNTSFTISSILQYDNSSQKIGFNCRASYLFKEGTELFIVYNEIQDERTYTDLVPPSNRSLLIKFTYLLRI